MALKKASLACTVCGSRNYSVKLSSTPKPTRLEVNKFCKHVFKLLKDTTWPTRKERWIDFISVMEYTAFFVVIIYIFDKVVASGLFQILNIFS